MTRQTAILGIDLGTTELKAGLVTTDGRLLALSRAGYSTDADPATGRAEQDPEAWWRALVSAVRGMVAADGPDVLAIAVDGHGPTLVAVDDAARPTRPAIIWQDTRATTEQAELTAASGLEGWALAGLPAALWVERHEPAVAAATRWFMATWEFVGLRLTGRAATSLVKGQPFPEPGLLAAAGIAVERIPGAVLAGSILGDLTAQTATALGLAAGIPVVAGVVDAWASFHGAGLTQAGDAIDVGGAGGGFGVYWDRPVAAAGSFSTIAPLEGLFCVGGAMAATGRAIDWFGASVLEGTVSTEVLLDEVAATPPGADGVVFLPYLAGERSPLWDSSARGAFVGLNLSHRRGHLARAILEASALAIRHVAEPILAGGVELGQMRVCGGPARSATWNQIKADVTGFRVEVPGVAETAVVGAAILGATGIGVHPDIRSAIAAMTGVRERIEPRHELRALYDATYEAYTRLHPALSPIVRELATSTGSAS